MSTINKLDTLQQLMILTMEECGELIQRCSKCLRKNKYYDDKKLLEGIFISHKIDIVLHCAGLKAVNESVKEPEKYCRF